MISEVDLRDWGYTPSQPIQSKEQYEHYLKHHDWTFEYSDDFSEWRRGIKALAYLREAASLFDPNHETWNRYANNR